MQLPSRRQHTITWFDGRYNWQLNFTRRNLFICWFVYTLWHFLTPTIAPEERYKRVSENSWVIICLIFGETWGWIVVWYQSKSKDSKKSIIPELFFFVKKLKEEYVTHDWRNFHVGHFYQMAALKKTTITYVVYHGLQTIACNLQ